MGIAKFQPPQNQYPWTDRQKKSAQLITSARGPPIPNLVEIHSLGVCGKNGWNTRYNKNYYYLLIYLYFFSLISLQVRPVDGFFRAIAQKTWNHARMCLFGVIKLKFNFKPLFIPKTVKFWPKTGLWFFRLKMIIIIVAPWKLLVNRQIRVGNSKYGTLDHIFWSPVPNGDGVKICGPKLYSTNSSSFPETHCSRYRRCTLC